MEEAYELYWGEVTKDKDYKRGLAELRQFRKNARKTK